MGCALISTAWGIGVPKDMALYKKLTLLAFLGLTDYGSLSSVSITGNSTREMYKRKCFPWHHCYGPHPGLNDIAWQQRLKSAPWGFIGCHFMNVPTSTTISFIAKTLGYVQLREPEWRRWCFWCCINMLNYLFV